MSFLQKFFSGLRALFRKKQEEREMDEELRSYLDAVVQQKMRDGMSPEQALRAARVELGSMEAVKENIRSAGWESNLEGLWQDLRYALRQLRKNPGFAAVAVFTLALGIGANAAIFSVVDGLFLHSLPAKDPHQLLWLYPKRQGRSIAGSYPEYLDLCRQSTAFAGIIALSRHMAFVRNGDDLVLIKADFVSENYFSALGVNAIAGRTFAPGEDWQGYKQPPVVISYGLWLRRFGADRGIVGKTFMVNNRNAVILGVAPQWFGGLQRGMATEVWLPMNAWESPQDLQSREYRDFELLGRLRPGSTVAQARVELDTIAHRQSNSFPATDKGITFTAETETERLHEALPVTILALGAVGLILAICCANVSGIMLARAHGRRQEVAVRMALGAGRGRLLRQTLTESMMLALLGAALGVGFTSVLLRLQPALMPPGPFVMRFDFRVDGRMLAYTVAVSLLAALLSGLAPALTAWRANLLAAIKSEEGEKERGRWWLGARNFLVAGQVALALTLLVTAGLFLRSLAFSQRINPGFDPSKKLLIVSLSPSIGIRTSSQKFFLPAVEKLRALPGVRGATYAFRMLLSGSGGGVSCEVTVPGVEPPSGEKGFVVKYNSVGQDYFRTVGAHLLRGRAFDSREENLAERSVVVNESMARRFWPDADPIGKHVVVEGSNYQVVGMVQDGRINDIHEPLEPYLYFPFAQKHWGEGSIIVESAGDPREIVGVVKQQIRSIDKGVLFFSVETMKELMGGALWGDRMIFLLLAILGCLGILLTAVGLYGVVGYMARRRTHEIGIRVALGARREDVVALVVKQGLRLVLMGCLLGILVAAVVTQLVASQLYGIKPMDPIVFLGSIVLVAVVTLFASYVPARRASKVDPMVALRYE